MAKFLKIAALALAGLLVIGCGGSGILNPFAGNWAGTWTETNPATNGRWTSVTILGTTIFGTETNNTTPALTGSFTGSINVTGPNTATVSVTSTYGSTITGTLTLTTSTHIDGSLTETNGATPSPMTLHLDMN